MSRETRKKSKYQQKKEEQGTAHQIPNITPKTNNQKDYFDLLRTHQVTIAMGNAGSGKTFIASYWAAKQYLAGAVDKIIVTRPYIQMGKDPGAVPGTDFEKLEPYLKPILNNLSKFLGQGNYQYMIDKGIIEVAPVEKIRGRSFDDPCIIICDEMQNSNIDQIIAMVTRIGEYCQMVVCGDPDQHDLRSEPGIVYLDKLRQKYKIPDIGCVKFTEEDCVRSGVAKDVLVAVAKERKC